MYKIESSQIEGEGIIATKFIKPNTYIGTPLYIRWGIFPVITSDLGEKINHSWKPNSRLVRDKNGALRWDLISVKTIKKNEEITINYKETPWFIDGPLAHWQ